MPGAGQPTLSHAYLLGLETSGCASSATGWTPHHILLERDAQLRAAAPCYLKDHSRGEFVFDWAWADLYARVGRDWYPKLVCASPFTPVPGRRLLGDDGDGLAAALVAEAEQLGVASAQVLFHLESETGALATAGLMLRTGCRFVWRDAGYRDMQDFTARMTARRRKELKRERRKVAEAGIRFRVAHGDALSDSDIERIYACYLDPYQRRMMPPYLSPGFIHDLARTLGRSLVCFLAEQDREVVAMALCLRDQDTLYGRHWGALVDVPCLHFEACYYQGIEYCLQEGLTVFDPGTQGEHKIQRGFAPELDRSSYWVRDGDMRSELDRYLGAERAAVRRYRDAARELLPFHEITP